MHFDEGLLARQQSGETTKGVTKASRGKLPSQKLTEEELIKFTSRVAVQVSIAVILSNDVIDCVLDYRQYILTCEQHVRSEP